jgi:hypothetical protein
MSVASALVAASASAKVVMAQPAPIQPYGDEPVATPPAQPNPKPNPDPDLNTQPIPQPQPRPTPDPVWNAQPAAVDVDSPVGAPVRKLPPPIDVPDPRIDMPMLLTTPTGWLLPGAVMYSRTGLDTGGGFTTDERVGLGDVAEFGISTLDQVRERAADADQPNQIQPYFAATFRMGVAEERLFPYQPGLVLGFEKSFQRDTDGFKTRIAELTLVASKHLGKRFSLHFGGAFWDASMEADGSTTENTLHERDFHPLSDQVRVFGGITARPFDKSEIVVDWGYGPEFCYTCAPADQIQLTPELSWGVRYQVADWMTLESGVHVFDIDKAKLLDAQIFGQVTFTTWALRHVVDRLK